MAAMPDVEEEDGDDMDDGEEEKGDEEVKERSNFPDTWLWDLLLTKLAYFLAHLIYSPGEGGHWFPYIYFLKTLNIFHSKAKELVLRYLA